MAMTAVRNGVTGRWAKAPSEVASQSHGFHLDLAVSLLALPNRLSDEISVHRSDVLLNSMLLVTLSAVCSAEYSYLPWCYLRAQLTNSANGARTCSIERKHAH